MAVGMACAGTCLREAISLLEPMLTDNTDFVRQGALIAMALVMMQQPENRLGPLRKRLDKIIKDKHEEVGRVLGVQIWRAHRKPAPWLALPISHLL